MEKIMEMPLSTLENLKIFKILDNGDVDPEVRMDVIMKLQEICSQVAISCKNLSLDPISMSKRFHLHQYISEVTGWSTQYTDGGGWSAKVIVGPYTTFPKYGDLSTSWAPTSPNGKVEFLEFKYAVPYYICGLDIFETYHPGHVTLLEAYNQNNQKWETIWHRDDVEIINEQISRIFSPRFPTTKFKSNWIRMTMDCTKSPSWVEIDAVRMRGRESYQWCLATHFQFSHLFRRRAEGINTN